MSEVVVPRLPGRDELVRFFAERPSLHVREAAKLLGWPGRKLLQHVREEGGLLPGHRVAWAEVAFWLLQVWPRAALLRELGDGAILIPRGLHLTPVPWELPVYLVRAMEAQAIVQRELHDDLHGFDVQEHVARTLDMMVDGTTLELFRNDPDFIAAYEYPPMEEDGG
jgi:hypothetical protein